MVTTHDSPLGSGGEVPQRQHESPHEGVETGPVAHVGLLDGEGAGRGPPHLLQIGEEGFGADENAQDTVLRSEALEGLRSVGGAEKVDRLALAVPHQRPWPCRRERSVVAQVAARQVGEHGGDAPVQSAMHCSMRSRSPKRNGA